MAPFVWKSWFNSPPMSPSRVLLSNTHAETLLLQLSSCLCLTQGWKVWFGWAAAATRGINSCWERLGEPEVKELSTAGICWGTAEERGAAGPGGTGVTPRHLPEPRIPGGWSSPSPCAPGRPAGVHMLLVHG